MEFNATISKHDNCICSACYDIGRVIKITLPLILNHDDEVISTPYREYWLCDSCKAKLIKALGVDNVVMIQNGNNNTHINHIDTLNL